MLPNFIDEILKPFEDNYSNNIDDLVDLQNDLKEKFEEDGIPISKRRMMPWNVTYDIGDSLKTNLENRNYKRAAIDLLMLGLQAMPSYVKKNFNRTENGSEVESVEFNYTGLVIPWATLPMTKPFPGMGVLAINVVNIVAGLVNERSFKEHEWNHLFDLYVLQELYERDLITDMEKATADVSAEHQYKTFTFDEMKKRSYQIVERLVPEENRILASEYFN